MLIRSTLSVLGLYQYDNTIFDNLRVPEGMDKEIIVNDILSECAELEIIYPNPNILKNLIKNWTVAELPIWERLYEAATAEFNPLYNVDAHETEKIERKLKGDYKQRGSQHNKGSNTSSTVGYNSDEWKNKDKDENNNRSHNFNKGDNSEDETIVNTRRRYGNIGVTKSTDLIRDAWELYPVLNCYKAIVDSFKSRFCIEVY